MTESNRANALITGASSGLGRDYAALFAADEIDVVLVARRKERLDELAARLEGEHGVSAHVFPADLMDPRAPEAIFDYCAERSLAVEYLVNNAGFGTCGAFAGQDLSRELGMIAVNITALTHLTGLFLPAMLERGSGRVLNIGSTAGFQPGPYMATYYATKAYVNHFSEALWHEVAGTGVTVTVSCPGATATEFPATSGNGKAKLFTRGAVMTSEEVALAGYRAMMNGGRMAVHGLRNKLAVQTLRVSPRSTVQRVAARLNQS